MGEKTSQGMDMPTGPWEVDPADVKQVISEVNKEEGFMSSTIKAHISRILRCTSRAFGDVLTIASILPACCFGYAAYKFRLYLIMFCLHSITIDQAPMIRESLKQIYAEVKTEGFDSIKTRLARLLPWNLWPSLRWSSLKVKMQNLLDRLWPFETHEPTMLLP
jgi:hypothetical protein